MARSGARRKRSSRRSTAAEVEPADAGRADPRGRRGDMNETGATSSSAGGAVGAHPPVEPLELLVAPSTADQLNTVRLRLIPLACWRVDDLRFRFDSSVVLPSIQQEMERLAELLR